jgi:hypothetical protein
MGNAVEARVFHILRQMIDRQRAARRQAAGPGLGGGNRALVAVGHHHNLPACRAAARGQQPLRAERAAIGAAEPGHRLRAVRGQPAGRHRPGWPGLAGKAGRHGRILGRRAHAMAHHHHHLFHQRPHHRRRLRHGRGGSDKQGKARQQPGAHQKCTARRRTIDP